MPAMISAPQPLAVEAGAQMLAAGGNAFDAAVQCNGWSTLTRVVPAATW